MLKREEKIMITGRSVIEGVEACGFQAQIDSTNPNEMSINSWHTDKEVYKANRAACRADQAEFEDYCYGKQDEMIAAKASAETTEENTEA